MKFTMPVDKVVASLKGHAIEFIKGVPTHVPKQCWADVQAAGAVPENQEEVAQAQAAVPKTPTVADVDERKTLIFGAFTKMVEANKRGDFTGAGYPQIKTLEKLLGFDVDMKERDALWIEFTQGGGTSP